MELQSIDPKVEQSTIGSDSTEPTDEECEDYDDLDLDGLSNQAAEMDLEGEFSVSFKNFDSKNYSFSCPRTNLNAESELQIWTTTVPMVQMLNQDLKQHQLRYAAYRMPNKRLSVLYKRFQGNDGRRK